MEELAAAIDPEGRDREKLRIEGNNLYAGVAWYQNKGALTIQRSGLISSNLTRLEGQLLLPLGDLKRALGASLRANEKLCVLRLDARGCTSCTLAPTHWYYTTAT